jgi:hypothetical protein
MGKSQKACNHLVAVSYCILQAQTAENSPSVPLTAPSTRCVCVATRSVAEQLEDVEKELANLDPAARQLLEASTATWLQPDAAAVLKESQVANKLDAPK